MQTAPTSCRVLELVAQHGWVPEEQVKPLNNSLTRIEILTRYVRAVTMERVWNLPRLHKAAASEHSATATSTLARQSQAGCTGGVPDDFVPITESSCIVSDGGVVERLVDPMKMDSLKQDKTDTELKSNHSLANIGHQPVIDQPTGSLQIPSSPAPVPPPDGTLCIYRRAWSNLERPPRPPPPPPACSRSSSCQLVD